MPDQMTRRALLELDGVETCYGLSQALFGMSLAVGAGEMVTLMGRNGMGKTTTVRSIMGLHASARRYNFRFRGRDIRGSFLRTASRSWVSASSRKGGRSFPT